MAVKQILGKVTVTPKGEYSSSETYKRLDIVTSNGQSYIAKVDNTGVNVTNTNTWLQLVEKPEKGIDYFTEEDIAQLVSMVTDDSESEFNEYYNGKVSDFNSNASSKTSEFNSNYDEKVESFNTIFDTSTDNFDGNYETKLSAFNENASTQTSTFNSVVEQATSDFNSNASTLTETFNTNASEKTSAFNINASEKTQEFNDNVDEKTEQITSQLDNYVQFDNYPSNEKAGVINGNINGFQVSSSGNPYAKEYTAEEYDNVGNQVFIGKGTLENAKDKIVGSSTPVKNLNNSLKDITPKNNAEGTDNVFADGLESPLYDLGGDGQSIQDGTPTPDTPVEINSIEGSVEFACRGKSLLNATKEEYTTNGLTVSFDNSNMYINGATTQNAKYVGTSYKLGKGTYTLSLNILKGNITSSDRGAIFYLYEGTSYTVLNKSILLKSNTKGYSTFTLDKETNVTLGLFARTTETFNNVVLQYQVTKGENPDYNFEPYIEPNQVTFNLGQEKLRSVGDVKDELVVDLDTGDYYKVENVGEVVYLNTDNFSNNGQNDARIQYLTPIIENIPISYGDQLDNIFKSNIISPLYKQNDTSFAGTTATSKIRISINRKYLNIDEESNAGYLGALNKLLQSLNEDGNPFTIHYPLAKPTTKKLGTLSAEDLAKLKTFKGYNNVTVNTNLGLMNIRFTYGLDIKKYVDNKIAELSAQMIKGE